ncbi:facilitated trehalose transporter Tret1-like isoform X2 [Dermacentor variabilis]|uniref:facilitated trehalose transporter Tret1-like isoform X2 n=1 Tax=Dermacentor variabilis TaxID=34621 RepID=UPI003F5B9ABC
MKTHADSRRMGSIDFMPLQNRASNGMPMSPKPYNMDYSPGFLKGNDFADGQPNCDAAKAAAARLRLSLCVAAAYLAMMSVGLMCAYSSPALPGIRQRFGLTEDEATWFGSLVLPGAVLGGLIGGQLVNLMGRRKTMVTVAVWFVSGWICIILAPSTPWLFVGRFLTGGGMGTAAPATSVYLSEVSPAHLRGLLNTGCNLLMAVGILMGYVMGKWLYYTWLAIACLVPAFVSGAAFALYVQESPRWLILKGRRGQALETLKFYRGPLIGEEFSSLERSVVDIPGLTLAEMRKPHIYKPFLYSLLPMLMQQAGAINVVLFYAKDIFDEAGASLESDNCSIILGGVTVVTFFVATILADRAGRKALLIASSVITMIGLGLLGMYFHLKEMNGEEFSKQYGWFPLLAIGLYAVGHSLGLGPLPFVLLGEMIPLKAKGVASSICTAFLFATGFLVVKEHFDIQYLLGAAGAYWLYGALVLVAFVPFVVFVPETKGKSLEEIEKLFCGSGSEPAVFLKEADDAQLRRL